MSKLYQHRPVFRRLATLMLLATLAACAAKRPAPVTESRPGQTAVAPATDSSSQPGAMPSAAGEARPVAPGEKIHVIQKGDTLISIALANGLDYRELAIWNNIDNPNVIKLGEAVRLTPPGSNIAVTAAPGQLKPGEPIASPLIITPMPVTGTATGNTDRMKTEPLATKVPYSDAAYAKMTADAAAAAAAAPAAAAPATATPVVPAAAATTGDDVNWSWPIQPKGKVIANFTDANKGIDISGTKGAPVLASAGGKVVYAGAGLRGYGRLVIIKHNATWLSAYAHNEKILVSEGQDVKKGDKIAEMGNSDADQVKLHFEIRRQGKPVDPMKFLPN